MLIGLSTSIKAIERTKALIISFGNITRLGTIMNMGKVLLVALIFSTLALKTRTHLINTDYDAVVDTPADTTGQDTTIQKSIGPKKSPLTRFFKAIFGLRKKENEMWDKIEGIVNLNWHGRNDFAK